MILQKSFSYTDLLLNKHFFIIINVENSWAALYFVEYVMHFFVIEIFCYIINAFTVFAFSLTCLINLTSPAEKSMHFLLVFLSLIYIYIYIDRQTDKIDREIQREEREIDKIDR